MVVSGSATLPGWRPMTTVVSVADWSMARVGCAATRDVAVASVTGPAGAEWSRGVM